MRGGRRAIDDRLGDPRARVPPAVLARAVAEQIWSDHPVATGGEIRSDLSIRPRRRWNAVHEQYDGALPDIEIRKFSGVQSHPLQGVDVFDVGRWRVAKRFSAGGRCGAQIRLRTRTQREIFST